MPGTYAAYFSDAKKALGASEAGEREREREREKEKESGARISANESENPPAARVATIFMGLLVRASDSRSREFASLGAQGPNKS